MHLKPHSIAGTRQLWNRRSVSCGSSIVFLPLLAHAALRLALLFHADVNHRVDGGAFARRERQQLMRQDAKLMEGVVGIVRLAVALPD
ncbi:hypothetical protein M3650_05570 [Paenibacillus sp. MER TA 81-3]|nr:hypothetical protein [Paenibacillus sp. MER TA 81-3]